MKKVTVFKANGQTVEYQTEVVNDVVETMQTGEYGYVWAHDKWILRGQDNSVLSNRYAFIVINNVPEELKMKLVLLQ